MDFSLRIWSKAFLGRSLRIALENFRERTFSIVSLNFEVQNRNFSAAPNRVTCDRIIWTQSGRLIFALRSTTRTKIKIIFAFAIKNHLIFTDPLDSTGIIPGNSLICFDGYLRRFWLENRECTGRARPKLRFAQSGSWDFTGIPHETCALRVLC